MTLEQYFSTPDAMTKAELARKCGVTPPAIGHYTSGRRAPSGAMARLIIEHTGGLVGWCDLFPLISQPADKPQEVTHA